MNGNKLKIKIVVNVLTILILTLVLRLVLENTVITNGVALGQMTNSDEVYLLMEYYNKIRTTVSMAYGCMSAIIAGSTICDIYKLINDKGEN